jgi:hypothetical protein
MTELTEVLDDFIIGLEARLAPSNHVFFVRLLSDMPLDVFIKTQLQFRFAVEHFVTPMVALADRTSAGVSRDALLANIADERGGNDPTATHGETFKQLLGLLGVSPDAIDCAQPKPPVLAFNGYLMQTAERQSVSKALAVFGIIEHLFAQFSGWIGGALIARGWLAADHIVHYAAHETLDLEHAAAFLEPLAADFRPCGPIAEGLTQGAEAFMALYTELYQEAQS